jgi:hypothetical protein
MSRDWQSDWDESEADASEAPAPRWVAPGKVSSTSLIGSQNPPRHYVTPGKRPLTMRLSGAAVQAKGSLDRGADVQGRAAEGVAGQGGQLPHIDQIRSSFGRHDVGPIEAHVGGAAADAAGDIGADAYATGNKVAFASAPDLHTAAHEAAHVVQQRGGVQLHGGVGAAGDAYERHADAVADQVVRGQSAEPLLDRMAGGSPAAAQGAVQRRETKKKDAGGDGPPQGDAGASSAPDAPPDKPDQQGDSANAKPTGGAGPGAAPAADAAGGDKDAQARGPDKQADGKQGKGKGKNKDQGKDKAAAKRADGDGEGKTGKNGKPGSDVAGGGGGGGGDARTDDAAAASKTGAPEPADHPDIPALVLAEPVTLGEPPAVGQQEIDRWVAQTGRAPAQHRAEIEAALGTLNTDVTARQQEIKLLGQQLRAQMEAAGGGRVAALAANNTARRGEATGSFDGVGTGLQGVAAEAHATVDGRRAEAEAKLTAGENNQRSALATAYANANAAVEAVVTTYAPTYEAMLRTFVAGLLAVRDKANGSVKTTRDGLVAANDPAKQGGGGDIASAERALRSSVKQESVKRTSTAALKQIDKQITPFTQNLDKQARETVLGLLEPYQKDLFAEVESTRTGADGNFKSAGDSARAEIEAGAKRAHEAIDRAVDGAGGRVSSERDRAGAALDKTAESANGECKAAGEEVASRIELRATEEANALGKLLDGARALTRSRRPLRADKVLPQLETIRASVETRRAAAVEALQKMATDGAAQIDRVAGEQERTFATAATEQGAAARGLDEQIRAEIKAAVEDFGRALEGVSTTYSTTVGQDVARVNGAITTFNSSATAGVGSQQEVVRARLTDVTTQVDVGVTKIAGDIDARSNETLEEEFQKKKEGVGPKVSGLRDAMDGWGTKEGRIAGYLRDASYGEIELIEATYDDHYQQRAADGMTPLRADLHDEMDGSALDIAISYLDHRRDVAIKLELQESTGFFNDDEERIEAVLRSASDEEIQTLVRNEQGTLGDIKDALDDCDLDTVNALLATDISREQRHARADAIRLFDAMEGLGTKDEKVKAILENASTVEQRQAIRDEFNTYATNKEWEADEGQDQLTTALEDDFSGQEETLVIELAKVERDETALKATRLLEGGEGGGTRENQMFEALDDDQYAKDYAKASPDEQAKMAETRRQQLNEKIQGRSDFESVDDLLDNEMGARGPITYLELVAGVKKDGKPVTAYDRYSINLEREVAQRKLETGRCEPELQLRYATFGDGTNEDLIKGALSSGGKPLSKDRLAQIRGEYFRIWGQVLASHNELDRLDYSFPEPSGVLCNDLSGDDWFDVRVLLCGQPTTAEEIRYVAKMRVAYKTDGVIGDAFMQVAEAVGATDARSTMMASDERFDKEYEKIPLELRSKPLSELADDGEKLQRLADYLKDDANAYGAVKSAIVDAVVMTLEIIGGVLATIATAGASSPVLAAIIYNMIISMAGIAIRRGVMGDAYGGEQFAQDFVMAVGSAGIAAAEAKAFSKLATGVASRLIRKTAVEAVEEAGLEAAEGGLRMGARGRQFLHRSIESATRTVMTESANTVLQHVTSEKFWDSKLGEALVGENSLGAALLKGIPKHMAAGFVRGALEPFATKQRLPHQSAIAQALTNAGANTAGILCYVDSYGEAPEFWHNLLSSNLNSIVRGTFDGAAGHRVRARNLARDLMQGDIDAAALEEKTYLAESERREIAAIAAAQGQTAKLPSSYHQYVPAPRPDGNTDTTAAATTPPPSDAAPTPPPRTTPADGEPQPGPRPVRPDDTITSPAPANDNATPNTRAGGHAGPHPIGDDAGGTAFRVGENTPQLTTRASAAVMALDAPSRQRYDADMARTENPGQRALIDRAVAAGRSMDDVHALALAMHGMSETEVLRTFSGVGVVQFYQQSCLPASYQIALAEVDPVYALHLRNNPQLVMQQQHDALAAGGGARTMRDDVRRDRDIPPAMRELMNEPLARTAIDDPGMRDTKGSLGGIEATEMGGSALHKQLEAATGAQYEIVTNDSLKFAKPGDGQFAHSAVPHDRIGAAVDAGLPVIFGSMMPSGHAQVIIGRTVGSDGKIMYIVSDPMSGSTMKMPADLLDMVTVQSITMPRGVGPTKPADTAQPAGTTVPRTGSGGATPPPTVTGGGAQDKERVKQFLDTLSPPMADRFRASGHAVALEDAPRVLDFVTRSGEKNVAPLERFITRSGLPPGEAIPLLDRLLATHTALTGEQVRTFADSLKSQLKNPTSGAAIKGSPLRTGEEIAAAVDLAELPRYAGRPEQAIVDLRSLMDDRVQLRVAVSELSRTTEFGTASGAEVVGAGRRGPDLRLAVAGRSETVGREMTSTNLETPAGARPEVARAELELGIARGVTDKARDYQRKETPSFTRRELAVHIRESQAGYNFDAMLTAGFLDGAMERMRTRPDTLTANAQDVLDRVRFYDSKGNFVYEWSRPDSTVAQN